MDRVHDRRDERFDLGPERFWDLGEDRRAEIADPCRRIELTTTGGGELRWDARRHELSWRLCCERRPEDRARDSEPDRPADRLEERQVAGRRPQALDRHAVLDDQREDRERRTDADAGDEHP